MDGLVFFLNHRKAWGMGHALFVVGPAGSGKTTFCRNLVEYGAGVGRSFKLVNLDPANIDESLPYTLDIREHITLEDVLENTDLGPNAGLILALRELCDNIQEFETESLQNDYLVFDCPGQLELFTHSDVICDIAAYVRKYAKTVVAYLMESPFLLDANKYLHGCLTALITMSKFAMPHINIFTKMDLADPSRDLLEMQEGIIDMLEIEDEHKKLTLKIYEFLEENGMLSFKPLNWDDENSIFNVLYEIDTLTNYWEDTEPKESHCD